MTDRTPRLFLPFIAPGQAQKEMAHNEALARLDIAAARSVVAAGLDQPPATAVEGGCWIVGDGPTGAWAGQARAIAGWTAGGWRFVAPWEGLCVWVEDAGLSARFVDGAWQLGAITGDTLMLGGHALLAAPVPAIAPPAGGTTIDAGARATLQQVLAALRHHGLMEGPAEL
jgi:hypothetical protein